MICAPVKLELITLLFCPTQHFTEVSPAPSLPLWADVLPANDECQLNALGISGVGSPVGRVRGPQKLFSAIQRASNFLAMR